MMSVPPRKSNSKGHKGYYEYKVEGGQCIYFPLLSAYGEAPAIETYALAYFVSSQLDRV
jgi:hypothetical protein